MKRQAIEFAAAAIGKTLGPPDSQSTGWNDLFRPHVKWPEDYSPTERRRLREAARAALQQFEAARA
jgi:hypothetical protein